MPLAVVSIVERDEPARSWEAGGRCAPVGAFVSAHRDDIVAAWEREVAELPEGSRLDRPALRDHLPDLLTELGRCLEAHDEHAPRRFAAAASEHALQRLGHGVTLRHVATEYRVLRRVVTGLYVDACGRDEVDVREVASLDEAVDDALTDAVDWYTRVREETREQFVAILGHDLRNPLNAIEMSTAYLLEGELDENQREVVGRIQSSAGRIARMVEDLLDLARIRLGSGIPVTAALVSMDAVARAVVDELRAAHPGREVRLELAGDLSGEWDRDRVAQGISNVIANAIEHGEDPIDVAVRDDGDGVLVEVTNAGDPIPDDVLPTLFEPYVRRANVARPRRSGLGLGLYITREIVLAHGGRIEARSSRDAGTTFSLWFPRRAPA